MARFWEGFLFFMVTQAEIFNNFQYLFNTLSFIKV